MFHFYPIGSPNFRFFFFWGKIFQKFIKVFGASKSISILFFPYSLVSSYLLPNKKIVRNSTPLQNCHIGGQNSVLYPLVLSPNWTPKTIRLFSIKTLFRLQKGLKRILHQSDKFSKFPYIYFKFFKSVFKNS